MRPREPPTFFLDHCLGTFEVATRLREAGAKVEVLVECGFDQTTEDAVWLPEVAARGWVVLTKDRRIGRRPLELQAIINSQAAAFIMTGGDMRGVEIAEAFALALRKMTLWSQTRKRPLLATVSASGQVAIRLGGERLGGIRKS